MRLACPLCGGVDWRIVRKNIPARPARHLPAVKDAKVLVCKDCEWEDTIFILFTGPVWDKRICTDKIHEPQPRGETDVCGLCGLPTQ